MTMRIDRADLNRLTEAQTLLNEYYEALEIQVRDTPQQTAKFLEESQAQNSKAGLWLAYEDDIAVGCVVLRSMSPRDLTLASLSEQELAGEIKRLFVRPSYRGKHIADLLVDKVEIFAKEHAYKWLYLDSKDDLHAAVKLYKRHGYRNCERYNENPQATVFLHLHRGIDARNCRCLFWADSTHQL